MQEETNGKIALISEPEIMRQSSLPATTSGNLVMQPLEFTEEQKNLIKRMCQAEGLDDNEFAAFLHICKRRRLDPILRQIYATKRNKKITLPNGQVQWQKILVPIVAIEGLTAQADRSHTYAPSDKKPDFEYAKEGDKLPRACTVWVKKYAQGSWHEFSFTAYYAEFVQDTDLWKKMPHHMLMKCTRAGALRMGWPEDCGGLYIEEEFGQDTPSPDDTAPERKKRERASIGKLKKSTEDNRGHGKEGISEALNEQSDDTYTGDVIEVRKRENRSQDKQWLEVGVGNLESGYVTFTCWHKSLFDLFMQKPKNVVLSVKNLKTHKGFPTIEAVISIGGVEYKKVEHELAKDPGTVRSESLLELTRVMETLWPASQFETRSIRNRVGQMLFNLSSKEQLNDLTFPQETIDASLIALKRYAKLNVKPTSEQGIENEIFNLFTEAQQEQKSA